MEITVKKKRDRLKAVLLGTYAAILSALPAWAEDGNIIISGVNQGTQQLWNILVGIVGPIAAVALAVNFVKILWGGSRSMEEAKTAVIKIIIAVAVVMMAPSIISVTKGWFTANWTFRKVKKP